MSVHGKRFNARASRLAVGAEELVIISYPVCRDPGVAALTVAEQQVLRLMLAGMSTTGIAAERGRAERTIANQIAAIYRKLGVGSRSELAARFGATS